MNSALPARLRSTPLFSFTLSNDTRPSIPLVAPIFAEIDSGRWNAITSTLTLLEVLVLPYRAGNLALASRFEDILARGRGLRLIECDRPLLRAAAEFRARFGVKTPDALQLTAAMTGGASTFVTNDRELPSLPGVRVLQLRSFLLP